MPSQRPGLAGLRQRAEMLADAFRAHISMEDVIAEGDNVVVRFTNDLVHEGTFRGIPATGRTATIQGIAIHRLRDGKIAERWILVDNLALLQQLGAFPEPNAAKA
jgi:predicted ester cyclase